MSTLDASDARIAKLKAQLEAALARIAQLEEENRRLREENRQLKERLNLNSSNSSKPPLIGQARYCAPAEEAHGAPSGRAARTQEA